MSNMFWHSAVTHMYCTHLDWFQEIYVYLCDYNNLDDKTDIYIYVYIYMYIFPVSYVLYIIQQVLSHVGCSHLCLNKR